MKRLLFAGVALALLAGATAAVSPANAATVDLYHFVGTVTDPLGAPLPGALVSDGSQVVYAGADGRYSLPESSTGNFNLHAERPGSVPEDKQAQVVLPQDITADFVLQYAVWGAIDHPNISTATGPAARAVSITSGATAAGACVLVTDSRTGSTTPASYVSTTNQGWSTWAWTLSLPLATTEGTYNVSFVTTACSTGRVVSDVFSSTYVVDNTPPSISATFPSGWTASSVGIGGHFIDIGGSGVDPSTSTISLDGAALNATVDFGTDTIRASATGLAEGPHGAVITVVDAAGNSTSSSLSFSVDRVPPTLSEPSPTGTITTASPRLSILAIDGGSGINAGSVSMTLSNGIMSSGVPAQYDPATGVIAYQIPSSVHGIHLGQFPLADGTYTVTAGVRDVAGNVATQLWSFTVKTLPV